MNIAEPSRFTLLREPANLAFHEKLAELARISAEIIRSHRSPSTQFTADVLSGDEAIDLMLCLKYFKNLAFEDLATRFVLPILGVDENHYLFQISPSAKGFNLFVGSVSVSWFRDRDNSKPPEPHYTPTANFAEQLFLADYSIEQAYLTGLGRIAEFIRQDQFGIVQSQFGPEGVFGETNIEGGPSHLGTSSNSSAKLREWGWVHRLSGRFWSSNPMTFDAGFFAYAAGLVGAAAAMALTIGPGWLGFIVAFIPASLLAAWAVSLDA